MYLNKYRFPLIAFYISTFLSLRALENTSKEPADNSVQSINQELSENTKIRVKEIYKQCGVTNLPVIRPITRQILERHPQVMYMPTYIAQLDACYINESFFSSLTAQEQYAAITYALYYNKAVTSRNIRKVCARVGALVAGLGVSAGFQVWYEKSRSRPLSMDTRKLMMVSMILPFAGIGYLANNYMTKHDDYKIDRYIVGKANSKIELLSLLKRIALKDAQFAMAQNITQRINHLEQE